MGIGIGVLEATAKAIESDRLRRDVLLESARSYGARRQSRPDRSRRDGMSAGGDVRGELPLRCWTYRLWREERKKESVFSIHIDFTFDSLRQRGTQDLRDFLTVEQAYWQTGKLAINLRPFLGVTADGQINAEQEIPGRTARETLR